MIPDNDIIHTSKNAIQLHFSIFRYHLYNQLNWIDLIHYLLINDAISLNIKLIDEYIDYIHY